MRKRFTVEVVFAWESDRVHLVEVTGFQQPRIAEVKATFKDPGSPAEGGELEDLEVRCVYGDRKRRLPKQLEAQLADNERFNERVTDTLEGKQ